jgi:hypothetical protein
VASPIPPPVVRTIGWLGYGGLIPFVLLTLATAVDPDHRVFWSQSLFSYGAVILTFVGALHWGFALAIPQIPEKQRDAVLIWSVVPTLVAWVALMFDGVATGYVLVAGFATHYWQDTRLHNDGFLPPWYLPLRFQITVVACVCMGLGTYWGR